MNIFKFVSNTESQVNDLIVEQLKNTYHNAIDTSKDCKAIQAAMFKTLDSHYVAGKLNTFNVYATPVNSPDCLIVTASWELRGVEGKHTLEVRGEL